MLFHSHVFLFLFLPLLLAGWYFFNHRKCYRLAQGYLTGMSLWFCAYLNVRYVWVLLASCLIGYMFCLLLKKTDDEKKRKLALAAGCVFHIGLLGYFKYCNFFIENVNALFRTDFPLLSVFLPLGISFYTFQQIAYLADCYRKDAPVCTFFDYLTFMVYFPQLLQGPIMRSGELIWQLHEEERRHFHPERFAKGMQLFVFGLAKKVLLADTLARAVNFGYENVLLLDSLSAVLTAAGYLLELYFDFSGYCDMAMGLGGMIGIEVPENFDSPFKSASVKEFWRRWHITLGRFFTQYVYIPLGGSRRGKMRTVANTMVVFLLSGLWHGASWNFVFWGLLHGIGVAWDSLHLFTLPRKWMRQAATFAYVCVAFVFFRAESIGQGFLLLKAVAIPKWNGFLFRMGEALKISELYILTKGVSMALPSLLPFVNLALLLFLFAVSIVVVAGKKGNVIAERSSCGVKYAVCMGILFAWSVLSMAGVSTYIYFSF